MGIVADPNSNQPSGSVRAALCIHPEALDRFRVVFRHLLVGLVDQAIQLRLLSSDRRVEALSLGPVQALIHEPIVWPFAKRRLDRILDALSPHPPTIAHALSSASYRVAGAIAEAFDADLVFQVTSLADCEATAQWNGPRVGRFLAFSQPLLQVLTEQLNVPVERVALVRPGVLASKKIACFANPERIPTVLCRAALECGCGVDRLIDAAGILRRRGHAVMIFLLGRGRWEATARRMIRARKLSSWVTVADPSGDLTQTLCSADILVQPSAEPQFGANGLQAMGAGMAVITAPSRIADYFFSGETAIICESDPEGAANGGESLARAIERLLEDRSRARGIAVAGMDYVRRHHSMSNMAQRTADAYRELLLARTTLSLPK